MHGWTNVCAIFVPKNKNRIALCRLSRQGNYNLAKMNDSPRLRGEEREEIILFPSSFLLHLASEALLFPLEMPCPACQNPALVKHLAQVNLIKPFLHLSKCPNAQVL